MASDHVVITFIVLNGALALAYQYGATIKTQLLRSAIWLDVLAKSNIAERVLVVVGKVSGRSLRIFRSTPNIVPLVFAFSCFLALLSVYHYATDSHRLMFEASVARSELLSGIRFHVPAEKRVIYRSMSPVDFQKAFQVNMILASQAKVHLANGVFVVLFVAIAKVLSWLLRDASKSRLVSNSSDLVGALLLFSVASILIGSIFIASSWAMFNLGVLGLAFCRGGLFLLNSVGFIADMLPAGGFYVNFPHIYISLQEVFGSGVVRGAVRSWIEYAKFLLDNPVPITFGRVYLLQELVFGVLLFGIAGATFVALSLPLLAIIGQLFIRRIGVRVLEWVEHHFLSVAFLLNLLLTGAYTYWSRPA